MLSVVAFYYQLHSLLSIPFTSIIVICICILPKIILALLSCIYIKTHGSESQGQRGSSKRLHDRFETHTHEYFTGRRVGKIENAITKEP